MRHTPMVPTSPVRLLIRQCVVYTEVVKMIAGPAVWTGGYDSPYHFK